MDSRIARILDELSDFDFEIEYMPGVKNGIADLMSRMPGRENELINEVSDPGYLPKELVKGRESKGGVIPYLKVRGMGYKLWQKME